MSIRVLVVDDSAVIRQTVRTILDAEPDIEVVATSADGAIGIRRIAELNPDVVTLDVEMVGMDGLAALKTIRERWPSLPVIMYSGLTTRGAAATLEALSLGAVDYATKPAGFSNRDEVAEHVRTTLVALLRVWAGHDASRQARRRPTVPDDVAPAPSPAAVRLHSRTAPVQPPALIVLGLSTGGPDALAEVIPALPKDLPVPVVVVQHMPPVFTRMLAERLDQQSSLRVSEAQDGEHLEAGHVYIAPGGKHLQVRGFVGDLSVVTTDDPPENSCRPAVDVLFRTATAAVRGHLIAAVLTGMGQDGLLGARAVVAAGGRVLVQDEASSVVWGMPGFVAREGLAEQILPLQQIAGALRSCCAPPLVISGAQR